MNKRHVEESQSFDIYRKTSLRYLGYFGLLARICAPIIPGNILKTAAMCYIVSDVADKSYKSTNDGKNKFKLFVNASDAIIWQSFCSVLIPNLLINGFSEKIRRFRVNRIFATLRSGALPYFIGVALLPISGPHIDESVSFVLDNSYRKLFKSNTGISKDALEPKDTIFSKMFTLNCEAEHCDQIYEEIKNRCQ